jgi:hypothetical protein
MLKTSKQLTIHSRSAPLICRPSTPSKANSLLPILKPPRQQLYPRTALPSSPMATTRTRVCPLPTEVTATSAEATATPRRITTTSRFRPTRWLIPYLEGSSLICFQMHTEMPRMLSTLAFPLWGITRMAKGNRIN